MKDSYSFDLTDEGLETSYQAHRNAYVRIFERLGLTYKIVSAVSGAMGGSASEEFLADAPTGEDTYVACTTCDYAANVEAASVKAPDAVDPASQPALQIVDTPDTPTIASLAAHLGVDAAQTLKNVVLQLKQPTGERELLVIGVPGDREVDLKAVEANVFPAEVEPFEDWATHPGLVRGYLGPQLLKDLKIRYLVDPRITVGSAWVTGANEIGKHALNVVMGRDFEPDGIVPAAEVREGDACPLCGSPLAIARGIEIGHVFQLGRKFADAFGLDVLGPDGKPVRVTMGSYGIGVSRAVAAIAEQSYDEKGLVWPRSISPVDVHVVIAGQGDQNAVGVEVALALEAAGLKVLLDDRKKVSPGVAFKDAELIGTPTMVVVGKSLADGVVEVRDRASGVSRAVPLADVVAETLAEVRG
jgi:prolyl-tRNA synthetase